MYLHLSDHSMHTSSFRPLLSHLSHQGFIHKMVLLPTESIAIRKTSIKIIVPIKGTIPQSFFQSTKSRTDFVVGMRYLCEDNERHLSEN